MSTTPQYILDQIQEAKAKKLKTLYLRGSDQKLTKIPEEVFELDHLEELILYDHAITTIPDQIKQLKQLKILNLRLNPLKQITDINGLILDFEIYQALKTQLAPQQISGLRVNLSRLNTKMSYNLKYLNNFFYLLLNRYELNSILKSITRLPQLTRLDLSFNQLSSLPESITRLPQLTELDLSGNQLSSLPESITRLPHLTTLYLSFNQLSSLPESITRLTQLTELDLSGNQLSSLPESITRLPQLTTLDLSGNQLGSLPESITRLQQLTKLRLGNNKLSSVSESITRLNKLSELYLENKSDSLIYIKEKLIKHKYRDINTLKAVPETITRLQHLKTLVLDGNPLESPPLEVALKGIEEIRGYFRQLEEGVDYLYEAKLLIVGEGGAGKTTLAKKIEDPNYVLQKDEASTEGIDVVTWHFPLEDGRKFRVNVWDFGGQEIYHATHQFFLTKRSLYALVADSRKEDTDFYYWLNVVELLAGDSPLLIIKNEKQDRKREINERQLRGEFDNLKQTVAANLKSNRGLEEILKAIRYHIRDLPHVGSKLPKTWVKVREALERDERDYITLGEYLAICERHGFKKHKDKLQLSGYLHDLGVCLHFQDDPVLKNLVIIKSDWATNAAYGVLDSPTVEDNQGKFSKDDLASIWHQPEYDTKHDELLQLMLKFNLCYRIEHTDSYIAPQLLSLDQPDYNWDERDNLQLRYEYEFMPKGIVTRFIVAMHHLITEQEHVWRSGVILQDKQSKAEVIEHYGKREIKIRVVGQQKKELMTIVRHELERIHRSFQRLKYKQLVPCNCKSCFGKPDPEFYEFETLNRYKAMGKYDIECRKDPFQRANVLSLIDDFGSTTPPERRREAHIDLDPTRLQSQKPPVASWEGRNRDPDPQGKPSNDKAEEKNWFEVLQDQLPFFWFVVLILLAVWSGFVTVLYLPENYRINLTSGVIFISLILAIRAFVWNSAKRAIGIRALDSLLVVLVTGVFYLWGFPPNVDNSCPNITLTADPIQIKPGESAKLTVQADDPEGDALNYTWQATIPGLQKEGGPHESPENAYTASAEAAGRKVSITVHVDDNQCGEPVSQEVTIPILLPDN